MLTSSVNVLHNPPTQFSGKLQIIPVSYIISIQIQKDNAKAFIQDLLISLKTLLLENPFTCAQSQFIRLNP
jgi:hypothetical protein